MVVRMLRKEVTLVMYTSVVTVSETLRILLLLLESDRLSLILASTWSVASSLSPRVFKLSKMVSEFWEQVDTKATALSCAFLQVLNAVVQADFDDLISSRYDLMLHRLIFGLREVRSAQQEQAEAPELLRHSVLLFLNAISVVVHSPARSQHNNHDHDHKVPLL